MAETKKENEILEVYDNQERYWLENTVRLMTRIGEYADCITASIGRNDLHATLEHLRMLKAIVNDEKDSCEKQLENSKEK